MAGWENIDEEIYVESVEEFVDTNPDLYKQRTIVALNERRYKDALKEAQLALKYGNQELQYHVLIVRVLLEMGQYDVCYKYLTGSGLWKSRKSKELLPDERNYLYYTCIACNSYAKINRTVFENNVDAVICMSNSIVIQNFATERIELDGIVIYPDKMDIFLQGKSGCVEMKDSEIHRSKNVGIAVCDKGNVEATNCKIVGSSSLVGLGYGVYAKDSGKVILKDCLLENNRKAICITDNAIVDKRNVRLLNNDVVGATLEGVKGLFKALTKI